MSPQANAAIPNSARIIPFQGVLTNSSGNYVADGSYDMVFSIYNVASAGTALWSTTHSGVNAVPVTNGAFSVNIGSLDANGVNISMDTPPYYLGIKVGTNAEMTPRIQLGFSPFAMTSKLTDNQLWGQNGSNIYYNSGNVGIGTTTPGAKLDVSGNIKNSIGIVPGVVEHWHNGGTHDAAPVVKIWYVTAASTGVGGYVDLTMPFSCSATWKMNVLAMPYTNVPVLSGIPKGHGLTVNSVRIGYTDAAGNWINANNWISAIIFCT